MSPLIFTLIVFAVAIVAGFFGSILGLGGGIIVIPALSLLLGVDIRLAIGAGFVSVIATSSGAAAAYVKEHMTNLRVAMFLEIGTTAGALTGALIAGIVSPRFLYLLFGLILAYSAIRMLARTREHSTPVPPDRLADRLHLHDHYYDEADKTTHNYCVTHSWLGLALMYVAGVVSGLLGIGSGSLKVPAMDLAMRLPIKVSTATSNLMMGVTAAAAAGIYFARGDIHPLVAAPVALGVLVGATLGSRILGKLKSRVVRTIFVIVLLVVAAQMLFKGAIGVPPNA